MMNDNAKKTRLPILLLVCAAFGLTACDRASAQSDDGCTVNANYEIDCGPRDAGPTLADG